VVWIEREQVALTPFPLDSGSLFAFIEYRWLRRLSVVKLLPISHPPCFPHLHCRSLLKPTNWSACLHGQEVHTFHIPVLGLAFSIDTPLKVARYGISSVISIVDDILIERMREQYSHMYGKPYTVITQKDEDHRARRITAYLNLVNQIVHEQMARLKASAFDQGSEIVKYFEMLAENSSLKALYRRWGAAHDAGHRASLESELRSRVVAGAIDVNIMTKLDKTNHPRHDSEPLADSSDAVAALRGFAQSELDSSVVLSAGLNPRLFNYMGLRPEFLPDSHGLSSKKVILKVSDYRSASIQGKILAKKGIWISEYRIESGLNCGGHAFATDGMLLGPILQEFKEKKKALISELHVIYCAALREKGGNVPADPRPVRITVQGGIGTAAEDEFLREFFEIDGTGWGSPFLLVPEATNVDDETRAKLAAASQEDFYISDASPLGIAFNNLRGTASEQLIRRRVEEGKPGSPCAKKYLVSNTEFTKEPICTASMQYQSLKIKQLRAMNLPAEELEGEIQKVVQKSCLCEDLAASPFVEDETNDEHASHAVAVCPGPNLAFFSRIATLEEMVGHIYGRFQLITVADRPSMFINELRLYVDYLKMEIGKKLKSLTANEHRYLTTFRRNLQEGISYYRSLIPRLTKETERYRDIVRTQLQELELELELLFIPSPGLEPVLIESTARRG
jgi:hypothetical protein